MKKCLSNASSMLKQVKLKCNAPLIAGLLVLALYGGCTINPKNNEAEILWDKHGVPHIYAKNAEEMYYAYGWSQMNNHANLILKLYAQARGRAAAFFGKDYLESDKLITLFQLNDLAEKSYNSQSAEFKSYLDAFVRGINDYMQAYPESIPEEYRRILPVTPNDILAHTIRVICLEFLAMEDIGTVKKLAVPGSNSIAISPSRSLSGNAMLMTNPHLPWSDFFLWFEAHLNTTDFNVYGVSLVGMPTVTMAFNDYLGWAHTVNPIDASDRYELDTDGDSYILDNKMVPFVKLRKSIDVLQADGSVINETFEFKYSEHGPVVAEKGRKAWAVRVAGLENTRIFEQYHKMGKAKNLKEFESALRLLQNPMFNVIYADRDGNILYLFNGNVPVRKSGDFAFWKGTINGTSSDLIWHEYHQYDSLPKVINPPTGFLQNCNDPPWICTYPAVLKPDGFPAYMAPRWMGLRAQRAVNLIRNKDKLSFDDLSEIKMNTGFESADRFLDDLLAAAGKSSDPDVVEAVSILEKWDRKSDSDSKGALLFSEWWNGVRNDLFDVPWEPDQPVSTPRGLKDPAKAVDILAKATQNLRNKYGSADIALGDVFRLRMDDIDLPSNGGPENYGILRAVYYAEDTDGKMKAVAGDTYIAITEFGKKTHAMVLLNYGNSTQPGNKHRGDQLGMMSEKKLRPALLDRASIFENLEKSEKLHIR